MAEFEDRLNAILGDPEAMGQIVSIAKALTGEGGEPSSEPETPAQEAEASPAQDAASTPPAALPPNPQESQPNWGAVLGALGGAGGSTGDNPLSTLGKLDPKLLQSAAVLFSEYSAGDDRKTALLAALKPFLKPERQAKVDRAMELARLSRVIRTAFRLFQSSRAEGGTDV